jgi:hypothetical protein
MTDTYKLKLYTPSDKGERITNEDYTVEQLKTIFEFSKASALDYRLKQAEKEISRLFKAVQPLVHERLRADILKHLEDGNAHRLNWKGIPFAFEFWGEFNEEIRGLESEGLIERTKGCFRRVESK